MLKLPYIDNDNHNVLSGIHSKYISISYNAYVNIIVQIMQIVFSMFPHTTLKLIPGYSTSLEVALELVEWNLMEDGITSAVFKNTYGITSFSQCANWSLDNGGPSWCYLNESNSFFSHLLVTFEAVTST